MVATIEQPPPGRRAGDEIMPLVLGDMRARGAAGEARYGTRLRAHNGRDPLVDAYQEAIDLVLYLRQAIRERDGK